MLGNPASVITAYPCQDFCDEGKLGHVAYNGQIPSFQFVSPNPANGPIKVQAVACDGLSGTPLGSMTCHKVTIGIDEKYIYTFSGGSTSILNFGLEISIGTTTYYTEPWANSSCYPCDTCFYKISASHSCNYTCAPFQTIGNRNEFFFAGCNLPPSAPNIFEESKPDGFGNAYVTNQRVTPIYNIEVWGWGSAISSISHLSPFDDVTLTDMRTGRECQIKIESASGGDECFGIGTMSYSMGSSTINSCCNNKVEITSC